MAECSKTEVFLAELQRMCYSCDAACNGCGFEETGDCGQISVLCECGQAVVQKWSDSHPAPKPKTYADDFFEKHPKARSYVESGRRIPTVMWCHVYGKCREHRTECSYTQRERCWNKTYEEE